MPAKSVARGAVFAVLALCSVGFLTPFLLVPLLPLIFLAPNLYRTLTDKIEYGWFTFMAGLIENLMGTRILVTGDDLSQLSVSQLIFVC